MKDPRELFEAVEPGWSDVKGLGVPMLHLLDGFLDSGRVLFGATRHLLRTCDPARVVTFAVDELHDYRSRRPVMTFDTYRWLSAKTPELVIDRLTDATGRPFLLMHGSEPDTMWETTIAATLQICDELGVGNLYTLGGIPLAVPHTRPTGLTRHSTDENLVHDNPPLIERMDVPAQWSALFQLRAGEAGRVGSGYVAHVPHYLSQVYFPQALTVALEALMDDSGLVLPLTGLPEETAESFSLINDEMASSTETQELVAALEEAFDAAHTRIAPVPTADEIGAEFERFLAEREPGDDI